MTPSDPQLQALRALHAVTKRVHASLDLTETLDAVVCGVVEAAGFGLAAVNLAEQNGDYTTVAVAGSDDVRRELLGKSGSAENWAELFRRAERWGSLYFVDHRFGVPESLYVWVPDIEASDDPARWHPLDCLFAPLMAPSGEWLGVLSVDLPRGGLRPGPQQQEILEFFAEHAAIAIQHARLHSRLERSQAAAEYAATHDSLTGLANRALLMSRIAALPGLGARQAGVLVVDLDGFKKVNDAAEPRGGRRGAAGRGRAPAAPPARRRRARPDRRGRVRRGAGRRRPRGRPTGDRAAAARGDRRADLRRHRRAPRRRQHRLRHRAGR
nr:hypothetical protein GCM10020092_049790 [Actinoplanes digitatis]